MSHLRQSEHLPHHFSHKSEHLFKIHSLMYLFLNNLLYNIYVPNKKIYINFSRKSELLLNKVGVLIRPSPSHFDVIYSYSIVAIMYMYLLKKNNINFSRQAELLLNKVGILIGPAPRDLDVL